MTNSLSNDELNALLDDDTQDIEIEFLEIVTEVVSEISQTISNPFEKNIGKKIELGPAEEVMVITVKELKDRFEDIEDKNVIVNTNYSGDINGNISYVIKNNLVRKLIELLNGENDKKDFDTGEMIDAELSIFEESMHKSLGSASQMLVDIINGTVNIEKTKAYNLKSEEGLFEEITSLSDDSKVIYMEYSFVIKDIIDDKIINIVDLNLAKKIFEGVKRNGYTLSSGKKFEPIAKGTSTNSESSTNKGESFKTDVRKSSKRENVNASPVQFQELDIAELSRQKENIDIILDVPLEVSVEMGRTFKKINEILEFSPGTVIELDQLAGDPIDIIVNGKFIAKGEVVVIDENYGIRVTEILNANKRL